MLKRLEIPTTAAKQDVKMSDEVANLQVLYKEHDGKSTFIGLHNPQIPDEAYRDDIVAVPLKSVYSGVEFIENGTPVWNAIGTSKDYLIDKHEYDYNGKKWDIYYGWINAWETFTDCQALGCYVKDCEGVACDGDSIVGGHMQKKDPKIEPDKSGVPAKKGDIIYIIPICSAHNHHTVTRELLVNGPYVSDINPKVYGVKALKIVYDNPYSH